MNSRGKKMVQLATTKTAFKTKECRIVLTPVSFGSNLNNKGNSSTESVISTSFVDVDDDIADPDFDYMQELYPEKFSRIYKWLDDNTVESERFLSSKNNSTFTELNRVSPVVEYNSTYAELKRLSPVVEYDSVDNQAEIQTKENLLIATVGPVNEETLEVVEVNSFDTKKTSHKTMTKNSNLLDKTLKVPHDVYKSQFLNSNKYKKTICKFCEDHIISRHFARHLQRRHINEATVKEIFDQPKDSVKRKKLLTLLRNEGNLDSALRGAIIPKRRSGNVNQNLYEICTYCKAYFKRNALSRHSKKCFMNLNLEEGRALSKSQLYTISLGTYGEFLSKLNVKNQVFSIMKSDDISKNAQKDPLVCLYGEDLLKKHRRQQMATVISNKLRECGRFLIEMRKLGKFESLLSTLNPLHFDMAISAVKMMSGYQEHNKTFKAPSLAMHFGTTLKQLSELAIKLVLRNNTMLVVEDLETTIKHLSRFKDIVSSQWTVELSSLAMKDLTEKSSIKPGLLPVTEDIMKLKVCTFKEAENAYSELKKGINASSYKVLIETVLVLVIIHNRKRVGDIQYLELESYKKQINVAQTCEENEFTTSLSESEKILTKHYKRIMTIGKGSKSVTVLIPKELQNFFKLLLDVRERSTIVPSTNKYLFSYPNSNRWINGCVALRKYAKMSGAKNPELITSSRLRKHIATVTQLLNLKHNEIDQLAKFMGHTKKTHETFYKLPQDIYQVAKVSKILQLMETGKAGNFQNKSLDEINIDLHAAIEEDRVSEVANEMEEVPHTSKNSTMIDNESEYSSDSETSELNAKRKKKQAKTNNSNRKISNKQKWSNEEVQIIKKHFGKFIREKRPPKKHDVEPVIKQYPDLFVKRNWVTIKAYVYNCYRDR